MFKKLCILVAFICGIDFDVIKKSIESFSGVERRSEKIGMINGVDVYHDYAHHPAQIEKMIGCAKELVCGKGRVITVFEPHTFSRTKYLLEDFAKSLSLADEIVLAPVYSARELETDGMTSIDLLYETRKYNLRTSYFKSYFEIIKYIKTITKQGDLVLVLGAGNIEKLAKQLLE